MVHWHSIAPNIVVLPFCQVYTPGNWQLPSGWMIKFPSVGWVLGRIQRTTCLRNMFLMKKNTFSGNFMSHVPHEYQPWLLPTITSYITNYQLSTTFRMNISRYQALSQPGLAMTITRVMTHRQIFASMTWAPGLVEHVVGSLLRGGEVWPPSFHSDETKKRKQEEQWSSIS